MKLKTLLTVGIAGLMLSACASTNMESADSVKLYKVEKDDFLQSISVEEYGCKIGWKTIYEANKDAIDNPNLIYPDQVLRLPESK